MNVKLTHLCAILFIVGLASVLLSAIGDPGSPQDVLNTVLDTASRSLRINVGTVEKYYTVTCDDDGELVEFDMDGDLTGGEDPDDVVFEVRISQDDPANSAYFELQGAGAATATSMKLFAGEDPLPFLIKTASVSCITEPAKTAPCRIWVLQ